MKAKKRARRVHDEDFKRNAVRMMLALERPRHVILKELDIVSSLASRWTERYGKEVQKEMASGVAPPAPPMPKERPAPLPPAPAEPSAAEADDSFFESEAAASLLALTKSDRLVQEEVESDATLASSGPVKERKRPGPKPGGKKASQVPMPWAPREVTAVYETDSDEHQKMVDYMRHNTERALKERDAMATVMGMMMAEPELFGRAPKR